MSILLRRSDVSFLPGSRALSIGTYGCNLACEWCQNWSFQPRGRSRAIVAMPEKNCRRLKSLLLPVSRA
jgi:pyruvate-formate lyase-activating enzyme